MKQEQKEYIQFTCKNCHARLKTAKSAAGQKGQCPQCEYIIVVPAEHQTQGE